MALHALERWPLPACRDLLEFCLNDCDTDAALRAELELRKKELDVYHWVSESSGLLPAGPVKCDIHRELAVRIQNLVELFGLSLDFHFCYGR